MQLYKYVDSRCINQMVPESDYLRWLAFYRRISAYMETENDILEETLSIAEDGYVLAYDFLLKKYKKKH